MAETAKEGALDGQQLGEPPAGGAAATKELPDEVELVVKGRRMTMPLDQVVAAAQKRLAGEDGLAKLAAEREELAAEKEALADARRAQEIVKAWRGAREGAPADRVAALKKLATYDEFGLTEDFVRQAEQELMGGPPAAQGGAGVAPPPDARVLRLEAEVAALRKQDEERGKDAEWNQTVLDLKLDAEKDPELGYLFKKRPTWAKLVWERAWQTMSDLVETQKRPANADTRQRAIMAAKELAADLFADEHTEHPVPGSPPGLGYSPHVSQPRTSARGRKPTAPLTPNEMLDVSKYERNIADRLDELLRGE